MSGFTARGRELLADVSMTVQSATEQALRKSGLLDRKDMSGLPEELGRIVADHLANEWGGQSVYIPMDRSRRNARIYERFDGTNIHALAKEYGVCVLTIYRIVKQERARRHSPQLRLPLD